MLFRSGSGVSSILIGRSIKSITSLAVSQTRSFHALPRDRSRRRVEDDLVFAWKITEGGGVLSSVADQEVTFEAPRSPGLMRLSVAVSQREVRCAAEALITIADHLDVGMGAAVVNARGLPDYTLNEQLGSPGGRATTGCET